MKKHIKTFAFALLVALTVCFSAGAVSNSTDVYVIGNPNSAPYESYNSKTDSYNGIMPKVFELLRKKTGYKFIYISLSGEKRETYVKNSQAEIISCCINDEFKSYERTDAVFTIGEGKSKTELRLAFTENADDELIKSINSALKSITETQKQQILFSCIEYSKNELPEWVWIIIAAGFLAIIIATHIVGYVRRKKVNRAIKYMFNTDFILNGTALEEAFNRIIIDSERKLYSFIYIYIHIEAYSDKTGKWMADLGKTINELLTDDDFMGMAYGSAYCVFLKNLNTASIAEFVEQLEKNKAELDKEYPEVKNKITYGVYTLNNSDRHIAPIINKGIQACRYAKKNNLFFSSMQSNQNKKRNIDDVKSEVLSAVENCHISLLYQPVLSVSKGKVEFLDVMATYESNRYGLIKEKEIRECVANNDRELNYDTQILTDACKTATNARRKGNTAVSVICDVSNKLLYMKGFTGIVLEILKETKCPAKNLIICIKLDDKKRLSYIITSLRNIGIRVCIDTGNLDGVPIKDIVELKPDYIMIDEDTNEENYDSTAFLSGIIKALHDVDIKIISGGVDSNELLENAIELNTDYIEGALCCNPLSENDAIKFATSNNF